MIDEVFYKHIVNGVALGKIDFLNYYNISF